MGEIHSLGSHFGLSAAFDACYKGDDDDWQKSARLLEFELLQTYPDTDKLPRCAVKLVIQYAKQDPVEVKVTYQVVTTPKIIVARDPFS